MVQPIYKAKRASSCTSTAQLLFQRDRNPTFIHVVYNCTAGFFLPYSKTPLKMDEGTDYGTFVQHILEYCEAARKKQL